MVYEKTYAVKVLAVFLAVLVAVLVFPLSVQAASSAIMLESAWSIDELRVAVEGNGAFSSFFSGKVKVDNTGTYYMDIRFKVRVNRTDGLAKVLLNDATLNIGGESYQTNYTVYSASGGYFYICFMVPVDMYVTSQFFALQCDWAYNTVNGSNNVIIDDDKNVGSTLYPDTDISIPIDNSFITFTAEISEAECNYTYLGPIGYQNSQAVVDTINSQKDTAHQDSKAEQDLQQKGNELQEKANDLQEEANETQKGIFAKITEFFNGFFDNLGNTVKSWIIPTSAQLSAFLEEVNTWFGDRLGFIWYPFDLAFQLVSAFAMGEASSTLTVPAFKLNILGTEYTIWNELPFDMDSVGIFRYVRYFTSALLCCAIAKMAINKWDSVIGGRTG